MSANKAKNRLSKNAPLVGIVCLLYASIVGNVFSLGVDPVEVDGDRGPGGVVAVLPDDALRLLQVVLLCRPLPPVGKVPCGIKRPTLVVETVGDLVPNNLNEICAIFNSDRWDSFTQPIAP